eukprot:gene9234-11314_t
MDKSAVVRSSLCNCLSWISSSAFSQLTRSTQLYSLTVVLGLTQDESYLVRASSCRAIGILLKIDSLTDDTTFLSNAASSLSKSMTDQNINVKIKACWSLANLCDHLISLKSTLIINDIPTQILIKIVQVLISAGFENPKIRSNVVRALDQL